MVRLSVVLLAAVAALPALAQQISVPRVAPSAPPALSIPAPHVADLLRQEREKRIEALETELAVRCKLHGTKGAVPERDSLVAIARAHADYARLAREHQGGLNPSSPKGLGTDCVALLDRAARTVALSDRGSGPMPASGETRSGRSQVIEEFFPWPPRWPSARFNAPQSTFADRARYKTLADIDRFLRERLEGAGYREFGYFRIRQDGFAVVTKLERIDDQGGPHPNHRFDASLGAMPSFNLADYLYRLFRGGYGRYRVFVFIATTEAVQPVREERVDYALATEWDRRGTDALPPEILNVPLTPQHKLTVLVYEFFYREHRDAVPQLVERGAIDATRHLAATRIAIGP